jgi:ATP-dependent RNA helicase HrpB
MSHLITTKVSQAAADQRRGRAGRLSAGHCYRLWSEGTQASLTPQTAPEILHADLAPLALELSCWGAVDAAGLSWLDPPPAAPLAQARDLLRQLEAIDSAERVTPHGRMLAKFGTHPRLAHMLVKSREHGASRLACDLAAILGERDILRAGAGARDVDLRLRVAVLRGDVRELQPGITVDSRAKAQAVRSSALWQRDFSRARADSADPDHWTGILLAWAYPDRIGRARGGGGRYLLANGRGAHFGEPQALAKSEFIVAAELDGAEREARIFLAAPVRLADLEKHFSAHIIDRAEIIWDEREHAVRARRERRLGALLLESIEIRNPDAQAVQDAALTGLRQLGVADLPWTQELRQWRARVMLMRQYAVASPEPWPDLSDTALDATVEDWAPPWISGFTRREHFARLDLGNALRSRLTYAQGVILEREAPTHFTVPSGSAISVDYLDGETPTLSVRLQEMFGLHQTPSIAAGRLPLLLKLLSPARRPVQITRDLVSFWNRGYHEVKKDLKGRYPKHYWPEDPYTAEPTRRARPRPPPR